MVSAAPRLKGILFAMHSFDFRCYPLRRCHQNSRTFSAALSLDASSLNLVAHGLSANSTVLVELVGVLIGESAASCHGQHAGSTRTTHRQRAAQDWRAWHGGCQVPRSRTQRDVLRVEAFKGGHNCVCWFKGGIKFTGSVFLEACYLLHECSFEFAIRWIEGTLSRLLAANMFARGAGNAATMSAGAAPTHAVGFSSAAPPPLILQEKAGFSGRRGARPAALLGAPQQAWLYWR